MRRIPKSLEDPTASIFPLIVILICTVIVGIDSANGDIQETFDGMSSRDMYVELPELLHETTEPLIEITRVESHYNEVLIFYKSMELTYLGKYFITAYCPYECGGSWMTASGATCHRASYGWRLSEPTTCAIDRSVHSFGTQFYIPAFDRTFVAEDTGPGVKGRWLDLFYEDYGDVLSFPTGYYEVYSVSWTEHTAVMSEEEYNEFCRYDGGSIEYFYERGEE